MKFSFFFLIILFSSCVNNLNNQTIKPYYNSSGFAYIYNLQDYEKKLIAKRYDNSVLLASHNKLKSGTLVKIVNPENNKSIILKIKNKLNYPNFYNVLITEAVAYKLDLNFNSPYIEIFQIKKNDSFIADKAKTFNEEKKIHNKAPVAKVKIDNLITNSKKIKNIKKKRSFKIIIGDFYSLKSASSLRNNLLNNLTDFPKNKLTIKTINSKSHILSSGPYSTINLLKNDYIKIINFGFEDLDVKLYE